MEPWLLAVIFKPLALFLLCYLVLSPARRFAERKMPDSKLKRLLLRRIE